MTDLEIIQEISTWEYLATTLTQPHQMSIKEELIGRANRLRKQLPQPPPQFLK